MRVRYKKTGLGWGLVILLMFGTLPLNGSVMKEAEPSPEIASQVIHNKGNIATTVNNYGYIGGWYFYGLPSGEWPRNSGHNYIGEMKFWMGAVTADGDTIVGDTYEEFQPLPSLISGTNSYQIRLSTDATTYDYDPTDTVGLGMGNPAYGWRIWNNDSTDWVYNQIYNADSSAFFPGGPTSLQQSFFRFRDGLGSRSLGLELCQTMYQWNYCYNENLLFVILEITNTSDVDYPDFAFAIYSDFDVGGPDGTGENGRLGDLVESDSTENLAWTYDQDGYDPGWGATVTTGIMGTKYLETPDDIGMTAFRTGQWETVAQADDAQRYDLINSEQYDESLPPTDQYYLQCTKGINLTAGKTVRVVFAIIAGQDLTAFYDNASMAQTLYDNFFVGPQPPETPTLTVRAGDKKAYLSWNNIAESFIDPLMGEVDFRGYKLYRSENLGYTWGFEDRSARGSCLNLDYIPIAQFQVDNPGDPIQHTFIDSLLINGMEYWYCLVAYDAGDTSVPIGSLQNGFGRPGSDLNTIRVVPRTDPAGAYTSQSTVEHTALAGGVLSDGQVYAIAFDEAQVAGQEYRVVFEETDEQTYWHLINNTSGDTVLVDQTRQTGDPGLYEIGEGLRVVVRNGDRVPIIMEQTGFAMAGDTTLAVNIFYGTMAEATGYPQGSDKHFRSTYELRFTSSGSQGYWWWDDVTPINLPFEVWNTTLDYQVIAEIGDLDGDQVWDPADGEFIVIVNIPYDGASHPEGFPYNQAWLFAFDDNAVGADIGDIFTIEGAPVNGVDDIFTFRIDGVDDDLVVAQMSQIRVVPDPYIVHATWENSRYERKIQFIHLPATCTVRIYSLSGDEIRTIEHNDGTGTAEWNLLSESGLGIAPGIYLYHVESEFGNRVGRFAVIK